MDYHIYFLITLRLVPTERWHLNVNLEEGTVLKPLGKKIVRSWRCASLGASVHL